jgi:hypothetical protein
VGDYTPPIPEHLELAEVKESGGNEFAGEKGVNHFNDLATQRDSASKFKPEFKLQQGDDFDPGFVDRPSTGEKKDRDDFDTQNSEFNEQSRGDDEFDAPGDDDSPLPSDEVQSPENAQIDQQSSELDLSELDRNGRDAIQLETSPLPEKIDLRSKADRTYAENPESVEKSGGLDKNRSKSICEDEAEKDDYEIHSDMLESEPKSADIQKSAYSGPLLGLSADRGDKQPESKEKDKSPHRRDQVSPPSELKLRDYRRKRTIATSNQTIRTNVSMGSHPRLNELQQDQIMRGAAENWNREAIRRAQPSNQGMTGRFGKPIEKLAENKQP